MLFDDSWALMGLEIPLNYSNEISWPGLMLMNFKQTASKIEASETDVPKHVR